MQVLNVGRIKFGDTQLILPTATFSSMPIFLATRYVKYSPSNPSVQSAIMIIIMSYKINFVDYKLLQ